MIKVSNEENIVKGSGCPPEMFSERDALKNFTKCTVNDLCPVFSAWNLIK